MGNIVSLDPELERELRQTAAEHFNGQKERIIIIKERIAQNRDGKIDLLDVGDDLNRRKKRLDREAVLGFQNAVERVNGEADFQDISIIHRLDQIRPTVCRIAIRTSTGSTGFGTGFMIAPGLLLTNHHVLKDRATAKRSFAQFGYEVDLKGQVGDPESFKFQPDRFFMTSSLKPIDGDVLSGLDFTVVAVERINSNGSSVSDYGYVNLDESLGKIVDGERCVAIQHPKGDYKKIVLKDIRMIMVSEDKLIYESDTNPGSSGCPVIALGTGMVVALHHSSVPKTDEQGNWLRKDGRIWRNGDGDDAIAWAGNEGIRVSKIIHAVKEMAMPDEMEELRQSILSVSEPLGYSASPSPLNSTGTPTKAKAGDVQTNSIESTMTESIDTTPSTTESSTLLEFELLLSEADDLVLDWPDSASELVPGFVETVPVFPGCTESELRRSYYLRLHSPEDPWRMAERLEALPHIQECTPDLPMITDISYGDNEIGTDGIPTESTIKDLVYDDSTASWNEGDFIARWTYTDLISGILKEKDANGKVDRDKNRAKMRSWNQQVINWPGLSELDLVKVPKNGPKKVAAEKENVETRRKIDDNLKKLKFVQLDTGYTNHSKVFDSYDLNRDIDFVADDNDARDELAGLFLKHPAHGSRTASVAIGGDLNINSENIDGHQGILHGSKAKLTPFRIAKSVILLNRAKELVDAVNHAIEDETDVMFMCMGTHKKRIIDVAARRAYDNGLIWVCAAGNQVKMVIAPALCPGTIAVAAINPEERPWSGSCRGPMVDIAAPGEDVYVPNWDKNRTEIMAYGSGTSYATPQVASSAMLWKAYHKEALNTYRKPWQVVEAFRHCLKGSARKFDFNDKRYGAGILDVTALLRYPLPDPDKLTHAYKDSKQASSLDLGIREVIRHLWTRSGSKRGASATESYGDTVLSARAQVALDSMRKSRTFTESSGAGQAVDSSDHEILEELFMD